MVLLYRKADEMQDIIMEFNKMHFFFSTRLSKNRLKIRRMQRFYFIAEMLSFGMYFLLTMFLACAVCIPPWFHADYPVTPYRAVFPLLEWKNYVDTPKTFVAIYAFQTVCTLLSLSIILGVDNIVCHLFTQTTLNLKILLLWLQELGIEQNQQPKDRLRDLREVIEFHQYIIRWVHEYWAFKTK